MKLVFTHIFSSNASDGVGLVVVVKIISFMPSYEFAGFPTFVLASIVVTATWPACGEVAKVNTK